MRVMLLYHPQSDHSRLVEDFAHDFLKAQPDRHLELLSLETREGAEAAKLYEVVQYPALLALSDSGELLKMWEGETLPLMDEVAYYARS